MLSDGGSPHPRCRGTPPGWWPPLFCTNLPVPTTGRVQSIQVVPRVSLVPRVQAVGVVMLSFDVGGFSLSRKQTLTIVRIVTNASAALQLEKQTLACVRVRSSYWTKPPRDPPARPGSPPPLDFFFSLLYAPNNSLEPNWGISHAASSRQQLPLLEAARTTEAHHGADVSVRHRQARAASPGAAGAKPACSGDAVQAPRGEARPPRSPLRGVVMLDTQLR